MCRVLKTRPPSTTVSVSNTFCLCSIDGRSQNKLPLHFLVTRVTDDTKDSVSPTFSKHARTEKEPLCGHRTWDVNIPVTSGSTVARRLCVFQVLRPENPLKHITDGSKTSDPVCPRVGVVVVLFMETAETASSLAALLFPPSSRHGGGLTLWNVRSQSVNKSYELTHEIVLRVTQQNWSHMFDPSLWIRCDPSLFWADPPQGSAGRPAGCRPPAERW